MTSDDNINSISEYRKILEVSRSKKEQEYKTIATILHDYRFRDPKIHKVAQKLLATTRRYYQNLDEQLKALDATAAGIGNTDKRRRSRKGGTLANKLV
jgi:hypothetical protein